MATIVTRTGKGSALTTAEMDANFTNLNNAFLSEIFTTTTTLTNQPNSLQELGNLTGAFTIKVPVNGYFNKIKLRSYIATASTSVNTPIIFLQYSTDGTTFTTIGSLSGTDVINLVSPTGFKETGWMTIPAGALNAETFFRIASNGGDGAADPIVRGVNIQLKFE